MAERKREFRVWVILEETGDLAKYDGGPILMAFKTKRVDYKFDDETMARARIVLSPPPRPKRKTGKRRK